MDPALAELLRGEEAPEDRMVEAIIRFRRPGGTVPEVRIVSRFGPIATCRLAVGAIRRVRRHPNVISLKASRPLGPEREPIESDEEDATVRAVSPSDRRRPAGIPLTGAGIVVGVVDWGVDVGHPNFVSSEGTTRLLAVWDQRDGADDTAPAPYGYGTVRTSADIDRALRTEAPYRALGAHPGTADRGGGTHGTHVLDIAAGNGSAGGPPGIAPDALLVFVHLADRGTNGLANLGDSVRLLEAVDFVRRTAADRPWVVNLSLGRHGGPHDGTTLTELAMDALLAEAPGRFIVQSAGNYFRARTHAHGVLRPGQCRALTFATDAGDTSPNELELWYDGADRFSVWVQPPGKRAATPVPLGRMAELTVGDTVVARVYHRSRDPNNGANHVNAFLAPLEGGTWTVTLRGDHVRSGRFDAWLERDEVCSSCQARFTPVQATSTSTTGTIANGRLPLVVGAYDAHASHRPAAAFSSAGPTRDHRKKPDIVAPGVDVLAARSAPIGTDRSPGSLTRKSGSSMAAPHVTGAVALCLQAGGHGLSAQRIRALVLGSATPPQHAERQLGRGYLDIPRLMAAVSAAVSGTSAGPTRRDKTMNGDLDDAYGLALAPAAAYRELLYRPGRPLSASLAKRFEVVAAPGERLRGAPYAGDVILRVRLGKPGGGSCALVVGHELARRWASGPEGPAGWYVLAAEPEAPERPAAVRLLDGSRRVAPGHLLLRPRSVDDRIAVADEHDFDEHDAEYDPVSVDDAASVPPFGATERSNVIQPLLSAQASAAAVAWSRQVHPATSGVTLDAIRQALARYVDADAVQAAVGAGGATTDAVLVECVHQFQVKCYVDTREHDGRPGESTLDSLGLIARVGPGLRSADHGNPMAQDRLQRRDRALRAATGDEFSASNWFNRMADPSIFGHRTKNGTGVHVVLLRKLRLAERYLLTLPRFAGRTPVGLAAALRLTEKHGGARPSQTQSTSVHTFGLAIDIAYTGNPWVRSTETWSALKRAARLISGVSLEGSSAPAYFSSLASTPGHSTARIWDELQQRNAELVAYCKLRDDAGALRAALQAAHARGTAGVVDAGESLDHAVTRWRDRLQNDVTALAAGDFDNHLPPERGFLTHARDLTIALRDHGCLAWGAVDLGPGARGSGDVMHYDARIDGAGRVLTENTQAFVPTAGHPCLPAHAAGAAGEEEQTDAESPPDAAKATIRAQSGRWGTDEAAVLGALRRLSPAEMAEVTVDAATIGVLRQELSGAELAAAAAELARGRVGSMRRGDIRSVLGAPARHTLGTLAGALARDVLLGHREAIATTGTGTIHGSQCPTPAPAGVTTSDCTEYVKDVLRRAFAAKGNATAWAEVLREATARSGRAGLKGTEVIRGLQTKENWEALFWAPDPTNPRDGKAEHPYAYRIVRTRGTYYGISVDQGKSVINYRRTSASAPRDISGIDRLQRLQFGVLAARGGTHMALVVNGSVYEVHWTSPATDPNAIEATPLEGFEWQSGVIGAPPGDLGLAWQTP